MMEIFVSSSKYFTFQNLSSTNEATEGIECFFSYPGTSIFVSYAATNTIILLPLTILTLLHVIQEWRQKQTLSHSDCFTFNLAFMELLGVSGCVITICAIHDKQVITLSLGLVLYSYATFGETLSHILTSVERYLAVVHPLTYLRLRKERGTRIRNVAVCCVWLLSSALTSLLTVSGVFGVISCCFLTLSLIIVCFCSLSVLQVLIRKGPGEQGEERRRANQGKKKAFYTIVLILATLLLRFAGSLSWSLIFQSEGRMNCVLMTCETWFHLPSSLVLPLLFLHRTRKLNPLQMCRNFIRNAGSP